MYRFTIRVCSVRRPSTSEGEVAAGGDVPDYDDPTEVAQGAAGMWLRAPPEVAAQYER